MKQNRGDQDLKNCILALFFVCFFALESMAGNLILKNEKNGFQFHEGNVKDIEYIAVNPQQSLSIKIDGRSFIIYPPNQTGRIIDKVTYLSSLYESLLRSDRFSIKHEKYGFHRKIVNLLLFKDIQNGTK